MPVLEKGGAGQGQQQVGEHGHLRVAPSTCVASWWLLSSGKSKAPSLCTLYHHPHPTATRPPSLPCPAAGPRTPSQSCSYQANSSSGYGDQWEPQRGQLSLQQVNAPPSTRGPASALLPNSQPSVRVGVSSHTPSQGLLLSPTSSQHRSSRVSPRDPLPAPDWGKGMQHSVSFRSLKRNQVCSLNPGFR